MKIHFIGFLLLPLFKNFSQVCRPDIKNTTQLIAALLRSYSIDLLSFAVEKPFPRHVSVNGTGNLLTSTVYYLLLYFTGYWPPKGEKCSASEVGMIFNSTFVLLSCYSSRYLFSSFQKCSLPLFQIF